MPSRSPSPSTSPRAAAAAARRRRAASGRKALSSTEADHSNLTLHGTSVGASGSRQPSRAPSAASRASSAAASEGEHPPDDGHRGHRRNLSRHVTKFAPTGAAEIAKLQRRGKLALMRSRVRGLVMIRTVTSQIKHRIIAHRLRRNASPEDSYMPSLEFVLSEKFAHSVEHFRHRVVKRHGGTYPSVDNATMAAVRKAPARRSAVEQRIVTGWLRDVFVQQKLLSKDTDLRVDSPQLQAIAQCLKWRELDVVDTLYEQHQTASTQFIILQGEVGFFRNTGASKLIDHGDHSDAVVQAVKLHGHSRATEIAAAEQADSRRAKARAGDLLQRHERTFGALVGVGLPATLAQRLPTRCGAPASCTGTHTSSVQCLGRVVVAYFPSELMDVLVEHANAMLQRKIDFLKALSLVHADAGGSAAAHGQHPAHLEPAGSEDVEEGPERSESEDHKSDASAHHHPAHHAEVDLDDSYRVLLSHCRVIPATRQFVVDFRPGGNFSPDEVVIVFHGELEQVPVSVDLDSAAASHSASGAAASTRVSSEAHRSTGLVEAEDNNMLRVASRFQQSAELQQTYPMFGTSLTQTNNEAARRLVEHGRRQAQRQFEATSLLTTHSGNAHLDAGGGARHTPRSALVLENDDAPSGYSPFVAGGVVATLGPGSIFGACDVSGKSRLSPTHAASTHEVGGGFPEESGNARDRGESESDRANSATCFSVFTVKTATAVLLSIRPQHVSGGHGLKQHQHFLDKATRRLQAVARQHQEFTADRVAQMDGMHVKLQLLSADAAHSGNGSGVREAKQAVYNRPRTSAGLRGSLPVPKLSRAGPRRGHRRVKSMSNRLPSDSLNSRSSKSRRPVALKMSQFSTRADPRAVAAAEAKNAVQPLPEKLLSMSVMNDFNKWPARNKPGYSDADYQTFDYDVGQKQLLDLVSDYTQKQQMERRRQQQRSQRPGTSGNPFGPNPQRSQARHKRPTDTPMFPTFPAMARPHTSQGSIRGQRALQPSAGRQYSPPRLQLNVSRTPKVNTTSPTTSPSHRSRRRTKFSLEVVGDFHRWTCVSSSGGVFFRASANLSDKLTDGVAHGRHIVAAQSASNNAWLRTKDGRWLPLFLELTGEVLFECEDLSQDTYGGHGVDALGEEEDGRDDERRRRRATSARRHRAPKHTVEEKTDGRQQEIEDRVSSLVALKQQFPTTRIMSFADCK